ncbi:MAG TPA: FixH family protein [Kiloniellales bacterium]
MNAPDPTILTGRHVLIAVLAFFGLVIAVNAVFIVLALGSWSGLSTDDAYRRGLAYNETLSQADAQRALGWQARLTLEPLADGQARLSAAFADSAGTPLVDLAVSGELRRPTSAAADRPVTLSARGPGLYAVDLALPLRGQWDASLRAESRDGKMFVVEGRLWLK